MNKLRELIERRKRAAEVSDAAWKAERKLFYDYIKDKEGHIADLIDAAQMCVVTAGPGTITDISPLRAALYKLTEGK